MTEKDTFTRDRLAVLDRAATEGKVSAGAFRLLYVLLSKYLSRKTGDAWPAEKTLAIDIGVTDRQIRRWISELEDAGYLAKKRGGKGNPNRYSLGSDDRTDLSAQEDARPDKNVRSNDAMTGQNCPVNEAETGQECPVNETLTGHFQHVDRTNLVILTGQKCPPNPLKEPSEEPIEENISTKPTRTRSSKNPTFEESEFDEFWQQYRRKVAKPDARKAYLAARKKVSAEIILAGLMRYNAAESGTELRHIKYPAGWLRAERWSDEPVSAVPNGFNHHHPDDRSEFSDEELAELLPLGDSR